MILFQCEWCGVIESANLCRFRSRVLGRSFPDENLKKRVNDGFPTEICSQCDPSLLRWHGQFERKFYTQGTFIPMPDGGLKNIRGEIMTIQDLTEYANRLLHYGRQRRIIHVLSGENDRLVWEAKRSKTIPEDSKSLSSITVRGLQFQIVLASPVQSDKSDDRFLC